MSKVMVGLHDWHDIGKRHSYTRLEEIAEIAIKSERLAVFRLKSNVEVSKIVEMYESLRWTGQ